MIFRLIKILPFMLILTLIISCGKDKLMTPTGLKSYLTSEKSGLIKSQSDSEIKFSLRYLPSVYQALKELNFNPKDTVAFQEALVKTEGHHYLLFRLESNSPSQTLEKILSKTTPEKTWPEIKTAMHFDYKNQFSLKIGEQQKSCVLYHAFPRIEASKGYDFMIVFKDKNMKANAFFEGDLIFEFDDIHFSKKQITLSIQQSDLNNIPGLKLSAI